MRTTLTMSRVTRIFIGSIAVLAVVAASATLFAHHGTRDFCSNHESEIDELRRSFSAQFPSGTSYETVLAYMRQIPDTSETDLSGSKAVVDMLHPEKGQQTLYSFQRRCPLSDGNTNVWVVNMFVDASGELTASEVALVFDDLDFKSRNTSFRFQNFPDQRKMKAALRSFIGTGITLNDIERMMTNAGAMQRDVVQRGNQTEYIYRRQDSGDAVSLWERALYIDPTPSAISWIFGAHERLEEVLVNGE